MLRLQAYKFRLKPTRRAADQFRRFAGCCRYAYNRALALNEERRARGEKRLGYAGLCKELTAWRNDPETAWLAESSSSSQQQALKNLDRAYANFFAKRGMPPAFKKKGKSVESFRFPGEQCRVESKCGAIVLPKIGRVRYFNSQPVEGAVKNVTVSQRGGHWFVSIQTEREVPEPVHSKPGTAVGVDVGIASLATLSTGERVSPLNAFRGIEAKLAKLQRGLSRKVKFSANWRRVKAKVAKLHTKAASRRNDYLHKLSDTISKNHALVVVEDLQVKGMSASARGTVEKPGRKVRQKAGLNKSILDQGWGEFVRQLAYKTEWRGGRLMKVPAAYTSQTCSACGHCSPSNRPSQSVFCCVSCGHAENADVNAAKNILAVGQTVNACGAASGAGGQKPPA